VKIWCLRHRVSASDEEYLDEPKMMNDHVSLPKLITRVTDRGDRTAILLELTKQFVQREGRRVLILSDRKSQLKWFYDELKRLPEFAEDVGYYIGGMKQKDLEISATKHVVLGTFAMASEGMNIPVLDTLVMASPKSDIVQSVGRILRKRAEDRHVVPLVVDVVDPHPSLTRQFRRRKAVYRKYEYDIVEGEWDAKARGFKILKEIKSGGGGGDGGADGCGGDNGSDDESWSSDSVDSKKNPRKTQECLIFD
jgi:superfamily II DNA or RNA helicase